MPAPPTALGDAIRALLPGLNMLAHYRREDCLPDIRAGITVAAIALPVAIAYAQLAGFSPAVGLYASMLPLVAYALFGRSRQLILGPDAATCAMVASALASLGSHSPDARLALSTLLALFAGGFCLIASRLRLGMLADFLSRPILIGFLNGVALSILLGQLGKLLGLDIDGHGALRRLAEIASQLPQTHLPTLALALFTLAVMRLANRLAPRLPAALLALCASTLLTAVANLPAYGIAVLGEVTAGLPSLQLDFSHVSGFELGSLLTAAAGIALISFSNAILTARSFAAKTGDEIDADTELRALGAANIASAISGSFAISAADSRTAVNQHAGGRTQMVSLVVAACIALTLLFLSAPLRFVPIATLGVILVDAAYGLFDLASLRQLKRISRSEMSVSLLTTLGVVSTGVIEGIGIAVGLSLLRFIHTMARPEDEILGRVAGLPGFHDIRRHPDAIQTEGTLVYRFNAPLVFFNAPWFRLQLLRACQQRTNLHWVILDMMPVTRIDATGLYTLDELKQQLAAQGIRLVIAGRRTELLQWQQAHLSQPWARAEQLFPTVKQALKAYQATRAAPDPTMTLSDS